MIREGLALTLLAALAGGPAIAADIRVACYSDGNECEVTQALAQRYMQANAGTRVIVDKVPYKTIQESLPVQWAAGQGPDIARVTDFGAISRYFLDMRALLADAGYWEANFGQTLPWARSGPADQGIYGLPTQLTITGPIVNKTLFEQAGVPLPAPTATWDDWAAAAAKVAKADAVRWKEDAQRRGLKAPTIRNDLSECSAVWKWAIRNGKLPDGAANPFEGISPPKPTKRSREVRGFTPAEAATKTRRSCRRKGMSRQNSMRAGRRRKPDQCGGRGISPRPNFSVKSATAFSSAQRPSSRRDCCDAQAPIREPREREA